MTEFMHTSEGDERYHYTDSGLDNVWLIGGVDRVDTPYGSATSIHDLDDLHHAISMDIISSAKMTAQEFRFLRTELELSQRALAVLLRASVQQIHRWENEKSPIPGPAQVAISSYYIESKDPASRMKDLLDLHSRIDLAKGLPEGRTFFMSDDHWSPSGGNLAA